MPLIKGKQISKSFGERDILKDISFEIRAGEKIGLVGWNGAGKTTLVKIIMKILEPDQGMIIKRREQVGIAYLPQSTDQDHAVYVECDGERDEFLYRAKQLGLAKRITTNDMHAQLSGGERLKLALAKLWSRQPELLILDEPTNHLDLQGVNWLIQELGAFLGAALIISHDRYFLDKTVTKIFEIEDCKLTVYEGNYAAYKSEKEKIREQLQRDYLKQQRKIHVIEEQIKTFKQWSEKAHRNAGKGGSGSENRQAGLREYERVKAKKKDIQIRSKLKRLDLELSKHKVEKPKEEYKVDFQFIAHSKRGKRILEAKQLTKAFNTQTIFKDSSFYIKESEKIGLIGPNGAGKTTFIKMLLEEEGITKGSLWKSDSLKIAYLSQDVSDLPENRTALSYLELTSLEQQSFVRTIFANMGMKEEKLLTRIGDLSSGEKTRVKLVKMLIHEHDILILDEPTNHLDLPTREQLEATLMAYQGTLIIISHDYYLIERLCDKLLIIEEHQIKRYEMRLSEYEERKNKDKRKSHIEEAREELVLVETRLSELLGKISLLVPGSTDYLKMDQELVQLMQRKKDLQQTIKA